MNRFHRALLVPLLVTFVGWSAGPRAAQSAAAAPQQPPRPTFRAGVDAVQVDLRVVDRDGHFVDDLSKEEFRIFEDGNEQPITTFALINIPVPSGSTAPAAPRVEPDVASNVEPNGRLYVIILDDLEDQATPQRSANVRAIAKEFIERNLTDLDRAALITTSGRRDMGREFTNDKVRLLDAARRFQGGYGQTTSTFNAAGALVPDNLHSTMISLTAVADWLAKIDGRRKGIVLISERLGRSIRGGIDLTLAEAEAHDNQAFSQAAARGNVSLYVVDPVGVPTAPARGIKPIFIDDGAAFDEDRIQSLVTLAEATGGFAAVHSNDFSGALERIVAENSSYYLLGFTSSNPARDGKFRNVEVKTTRPDLKVRARSGYVAAKEAAPAPAKPSALPPALTEILDSPLAVQGLALSVSAPAFRGTGSKPSVAVIVEAGANQLQFTPNGARFDANMTLAIAAVSGDGKVQAGERGAVGMQLSSATHDAVLDRGARVLSQLELKPGRYQLRIAALDPADGTTRGSVLQDLDVPDFSKGPLAMSGIAIASALEPPILTGGSDTRWKPLLGMFPTTHRDFAAHDELRAYVEIYDNDARRQHTIEVTSTIRDGAGQSMFSRRQALPKEPSAEKSVTHRVVTAIPLNDLKTGRYVLTVEARSSTLTGALVSRQVPFLIR